MKRALSIAITATVLLGAAAALFHPGNAAIPLVQAEEGPFKVRPPLFSAMNLISGGTS
jgi:hypothetical protein